MLGLRNKRLSFDSAQDDCHAEHVRTLSVNSVEVLSTLKFLFTKLVRYTERFKKDEVDTKKWLHEPCVLTPASVPPKAV